MFLALTKYLQDMGHMDLYWGVKLEEQLAVFLYIYITDLSVCHVREYFQRSGLYFLTDAGFWLSYV